MDQKRNGSGPPPPPRTQRAATSGRFEWNEPLPRSPAPYPITDDDDSPQAHPELLADDLVDDPAEEGDFVDSTLVREFRPTHAAPPPIPAPTASGAPAFVDDGEIALPPPLSQIARGQAGRFPFREVEDDAETSSVRHAAFDDDTASGAGLTGAAFRADPRDDDAAPAPRDDDDAAPPLAAPPLAARVDVPQRAEDDFGDLNEPSRAHKAARRPAPAPTPSRPRSRDEDDFGDLDEPSRAAPVRGNNPAVAAAIDRSGLAPALEVTLLDDSLPLPPPPDAALDGGDLPPLIAAAASGQSGVAFTRADVEAALGEPEPSGAIALASESMRSFADRSGPRDTSARPPASAPPSAPPRPARDDDDDRDADSSPALPTVGLAPPPTEPLGEAFPLDLWSDPDELIGRDLGRYRLVKPLSRGMTTRVYAAIDEESNRHVAVRLLGPMYSPAEARARQFLYEAQQLARLHHEALVQVIDTGTTSDHLSYYVMERLDGDPLSAVLRAEGPQTWQQVGILVTQICEGLLVAGDRGILASDLHLASVLRLREGEDERRRRPLKLLHVGVSPIASVFRSPEGNLIESKGTPPGVAESMAPEIASGEAPSPASVVYAIGVMMYELLTGRSPFRGESFLAVIKKQMYDEPTRPSLVVPQQEIPEHFERVVLQALAKDPTRRYTSIRALHEAVLAARAQEGELRRATAILALDSTFWDEQSARNAEPAQPSPEPQPLATFTADLRQRDPALAEAVLGASPPKSAAKSAPQPAPAAKSAPQPARVAPVPAVKSAPQPAAPPPRPEPSMILSQLAPPIRAPEPVNLPAPAPAPAPMPVIVVSRPAPVSSGNAIRNISLAVVAAVVVIFLWISRNPAPTPPARKGDAVADAKPRTKDPTTKPRRTGRDADKTPPADPQPIVVAAPDTTPAPETKSDPTPTPPEPTPPEPTPTPTPPEPTPTPTPPEPKPEPTPTPPEPKPEPTPPPPEPKPKKTTPAPASDLPAKIDGGRLKSRYASMEPRIAARCSSMSGLGTASGLKVAVKIAVDTQGTVRATATGAWANTPLGRCVEDFVESIRFNETQHGGSRLHTFTF